MFDTCPVWAWYDTQMKRVLALIFAVALSSAARAQTLELSLAAGSHPFSVNLALQNFALSDALTLEAAVSIQRVQLGAQLAFEFAGIGQGAVYSRFAVAYTGAVRFEGGARGAIGPVSLELSSAIWNGDPTEFNVGAAFAAQPQTLTVGGIDLGLQGAYRLTRTLVLNAGVKYGSAQSRITVRLENRDGDWVYGGGTLLAWQSNGATLLLTGAAKYSPSDTPYSVELQTSLGVNQPSGFGWGGANLAFSYTLEELGFISAYVNYEIWRLDVLPFRTGLNLEFNLGPGALIVAGYGGADLNWNLGGGGRIAYRLDLGTLFNP